MSGSCLSYRSLVANMSCGRTRRRARNRLERPGHVPSRPMLPRIHPARWLTGGRMRCSVRDAPPVGAYPGRVPEWTKGADCKSVVRKPSWVRIPPRPLPVSALIHCTQQAYELGTNPSAGRVVIQGASRRGPLNAHIPSHDFRSDLDWRESPRRRPPPAAGVPPGCIVGRFVLCCSCREGPGDIWPVGHAQHRPLPANTRTRGLRHATGRLG